MVGPGPDGKVEVLGVIWAGDDCVEAVDVSADNSKTWHEAALLPLTPNRMSGDSSGAFSISQREITILSPALSTNTAEVSPRELPNLERESGARG